MFHQLSSSIVTLVKTFVVGIPIGITLIDVFGYVAKVEGQSMQPLLNPVTSNKSKPASDYVFLYNWPIVTNSYDKIERGEIIALVSPRDPKQRLIKRVIGLSGDVIETKGYFKPRVEIPPGHCWVEGDHRGHSLDSNIFGPVALGLVKSKAKCIVWPPSRIGLLETTVETDRLPLNLDSEKDQSTNAQLSDSSKVLRAKSESSTS